MGKAKVINRLPQFVADVAVRGERGMTAALILGASQAAGITPIASSNLINSQFKSVRRVAGKITGTVGYTAEYALAVHEAQGKLKGQPRPEKNGRSQGVFWGPGGEPQFLQKGFEQAEPNIRAVLIGAIKV